MTDPTLHQGVNHVVVFVDGEEVYRNNTDSNIEVLVNPDVDDKRYAR